MLSILGTWCGAIDRLQFLVNRIVLDFDKDTGGHVETSYLSDIHWGPKGLDHFSELAAEKRQVRFKVATIDAPQVVLQ